MRIQRRPTRNCAKVKSLCSEPNENEKWGAKKSRVPARTPACYPRVEKWVKKPFVRPPLRTNLLLNLVCRVVLVFVYVPAQLILLSVNLPLLVIR